jgi:thymidylate synthase ThyX
MGELLCKKCDVFIGYGAVGVAKPPVEHQDDAAWLIDHCWVCLRSRAEVLVNPYGREDPAHGLADPIPSSGRGHRGEPAVRVTATTPDGKPLGEWITTESGEHKPVEPEPSTAITRYVDKAMFEAEPVEEGALTRPRVYLLSATPDPLGAVAAFSMMYEGKVVRDLGEITDDQRRHYWAECFKTALKTPLEAIDLHFMVEGLTRASWDQMRTQRTAVFAGESLRFAVKDEIVQRPGPSISGNKDAQKAWDEAMASTWNWYNYLVGMGIPAEDARGLLPMNVLTRGHWKTNLRNLESEIGKRLCTQAQFEWRVIHADLRRAVAEYDHAMYRHPEMSTFEETYGGASSRWQFELIANESNLFRPICFQKGACMFKASMDRGCTIRSRVDAGQFDKIAVEEWAADPTAAWVE